MAEDKEILKEIWEGKLPLCIKLSTDECASTEPDGLFVSIFLILKVKSNCLKSFKIKLLVPRQSYFFLIKEKIQRYFSEYVSPSIKNNEIWLDFNGIPLKWHYPIGLLFDLYANMENEQANLPWSIYIHFEVIIEK